MMIQKLRQKNKLPDKKWKRVVKEHKRNRYLFVIVILLAVFSASTAWSFSIPTEETEEILLYAYSQRADIDYRIHMLPTSLFPDIVVNPDRAYITALAEQLTTNLSYHFTGEREATIKGEYQTTALLSAYSGRGEESKLVWSKEYTFNSGKSIDSDNGEVFIEETTDIPLAEYLAFVERVKSETGFTPVEIRLDIDYDIRLSVETAEGLMSNESLKPGLTVFLGGNTFTVDVESVKETNGGIFQEKIVAVPWVSFTRKVLIMSSGIIALGFLGFLFLTISKPEVVDDRKNELSKIFKKHGDRIVKTTSELSALSDKVINVTTFEELIKVADELGRPIIFHQPEGSGNGNPYFFQVTTAEQLFFYKIAES